MDVVAQGCTCNAHATPTRMHLRGRACAGAVEARLVNACSVSPAAYAGKKAPEPSTGIPDQARRLSNIHPRLAGRRSAQRFAYRMRARGLYVRDLINRRYALFFGQRVCVCRIFSASQCFPECVVIIGRRDSVHRSETVRIGAFEGQRFLYPKELRLHVLFCETVLGRSV